MISFDGVNALAPFKQKLLRQQLQKIDPKISNVTAEFVHFVDADDLNESELEKIKNLLTYETPYQSERKGKLLLVIPRLGTISPWSSKATDIARNCGLSKVSRIERGTAYYIESDSSIDKNEVSKILYDRMTQIVIESFDDAKNFFEVKKPKPLVEIDIKNKGKSELESANNILGLALSEDEIDYLFDAYKKIDRNPTDVELMMFSVVNSEHCRHKIFNATWIIDGKTATKSLFKMIKNTYEHYSEDVLSAYKDNAAVLKGPKANQLFIDSETKKYNYSNEPAHIVAKVETHNHPTAIAPWPGASTGVGGEIRDEAATGRGAYSKAGLTGFSVSNLNIEGFSQPWEKPYGKPARIVSPLDIMTESPLGGAAFANEFGRPNLLGYFRTFEQEFDGDVRGYHKPIMIAGGVGNIKDKMVKKNNIRPGDKLIILGGPSMLIGLGGGSASSMDIGKSDEDLDFASVQRDNAEIQRRAQEVITACYGMNDANPIISIHDVGAGGISNAMPELVHDNDLGAKFELRDIPSAEPGLSPMEIWCNEAQERFVLAISPDQIETFKNICERERCPFAIVGEATNEKQLILHDNKFGNNPIDIPMELLFGNPPKTVKKFETTAKSATASLDLDNIATADAVNRVMNFPAVASKKFLITIGDRTVSGLVTRDQFVGRWQVPVSDVAVTASSYEGYSGEAMAMGERTPLALINPAASGRMAIGEAITNIAAAKIEDLSKIKFSANWMAASGYKNEDRALYETVEAIGEEFCVDLGVCIPVGKDSLSMRTVWNDNGKAKSVTSPLSLIITGFAPVTDTSKTLTPELKNVASKLILIDLGHGKNRLGGSALAQTYNQIGNEAPDVSSNDIKNFFKVVQKLNSENKILAYHDRSDGGLFATLAEMSFASRVGFDAEILSSPLEELFSEELGAVLQIAEQDVDYVLNQLESYLPGLSKQIGSIRKDQKIIFSKANKTIYETNRSDLEKLWAVTSYQVQKLRDNPQSAESEYKLIEDNNDPGLSPKFNFDLKRSQNLRPNIEKPRAAILREQGVNGHKEMAAAFDRAGFDSFDVHLKDLISGKQSLESFSILAVCGGFSYGDVLGSGQGFNKSILYDDKLRAQFENFFKRKDTLSFGVCNGCQMLSGLKEIIPGAEHWPKFLSNESGRFESRLVSVKIKKTPSKLFTGMEGSVLNVPVAHGEGRAIFDDQDDKNISVKNSLIVAQYVDNLGAMTETYPYNPNGSEEGITAITSEDGRATILMPHPERVFLTKQLSWHPEEWGEESPWLKIFLNARNWIG